MFRKQAACKQIVGRQLLGKLLVQRWRGSGGNVRLSHLLMSVLFFNTKILQLNEWNDLPVDVVDFTPLQLFKTNKRSK